MAGPSYTLPQSRLHFHPTHLPIPTDPRSLIHTHASYVIQLHRGEGLSASVTEHVNSGVPGDVCSHPSATHFRQTTKAPPPTLQCAKRHALNASDWARGSDVSGTTHAIMRLCLPSPGNLDKPILDGIAPIQCPVTTPSEAATACHRRTC